MSLISKKNLWCYLLIIVIVKHTFSVGKTGVISLIFPSGAINTGMGECGVSLADNIYSAFANPASLPAIGENNVSQFFYSEFRERLLPNFEIPDLYHKATFSGIILNEIFPNFDIGYTYSYNYLNMGKNIWIDEFEREDTVNSYEKVISNSIALRAFKIASIGINIKPFKSVLSPEQIAKGVVFDIGFRLEYKYKFWNLLTVHPAIGLSFLNYGQRSVYYTENDSAILPRTRLYGGSLHVDLINLLGITLVREREYAVIDQEKIEHLGMKIDITPFYSILRGRLMDTAGLRYQEAVGEVFNFNFYKTLECIQAIYNLVIKDQNNKSIINLSQPTKWLKLNVFYQKARNTIQPYFINIGSRDDQTRNDYTIGINLIYTPYNFTKQKERNNIPTINSKK
ncbi:MAG: hypothetical protein N2053_02375 [Chitinispirillaceae bacterium]|nr:hypothetical protein [Chitinispirillaceae bacterium]